MRIFLNILLVVSGVLLVGCGGGGSNQGNTNGLSREYSGITSRAKLSKKNNIKFIRAVNYLENLDLSNLPNEEMDASLSSNIRIDNHINQKSGLGYRTVIYHDYKYKSYANISGEVRVDVVSIEISNQPNDQLAIIRMKTNFNLTIKTPNNLLTYKMSANMAMEVDEDKERIVNVLITKYRIDDKKYNEEIEFVYASLKNKSGRLYVGSEGYVELSNSNNFYRLFGENNTLLELGLDPEEAIYETWYQKSADSSVGEEQESYQVKVYEPKKGQGVIKNMLNGIKMSNLYFAQYQVSNLEPPKIYEKYGDMQLIEYAFDSWHIKYKFLNYVSNDTKISIKWFVNNQEVDTKIMYELPFGTFGEDDIITVHIVFTNHDMAMSFQKKIKNNQYLVSSGNYEYPKDTFGIQYRTNTLDFELDLLNHIYFKDINLSNSTFSWSVGAYNPLNNDPTNYSILDNTHFNKKPQLRIKNYGSQYEPLYLRIYTPTEKKVVRFNLEFFRGKNGFNNPPDVIRSTEAVEHENQKYSNVFQTMHKDIDGNGLDDIIYSSAEENTYFLNISYQDSPRVFTAGEHIKMNSAYFKIGNFDKNNMIDILINPTNFTWSSEQKTWIGDFNQTIISIHDRSDFSIKKFNLSNISISAVADINQDGQDDIIAFDTNTKQGIIYLDATSFLKERVIKSNQICQGGNVLKIVDMNFDGLNDIICSPFAIEKQDENGMNIALIDISYMKQIDNGKFSKVSYRYKIEPSIKNLSISLGLDAATMIDNNHIVIKGNENYKNYVYIFKLTADETKLVDKIAINSNRIFQFFEPTDINHDEKKDLISYYTSGRNSLAILYQKDNNIFDADYFYPLPLNKKLIEGFAGNAILCDIDKDGKPEIVTVNGINQFGYINFK